MQKWKFKMKFQYDSPPSNFIFKRVGILYVYNYIFILVYILNNKLYILVIMNYHHSCDSYDRNIYNLHCRNIQTYHVSPKKAQGVFLPRLYIPSSLVRPGKCSNWACHIESCCTQYLWLTAKPGERIGQQRGDDALGMCCIAMKPADRIFQKLSDVVGITHK